MAIEDWVNSPSNFFQSVPVCVRHWEGRTYQVNSKSMHGSFGVGTTCHAPPSDLPKRVNFGVGALAGQSIATPFSSQCTLCRDSHFISDRKKNLQRSLWQWTLKIRGMTWAVTHSKPETEFGGFSLWHVRWAPCFPITERSTTKQPGQEPGGKTSWKEYEETEKH